MNTTENTSENTVYHIATLAEWESYQKKGIIEPVSLQNEGFIHCSTEEQLMGTLARFYSFEEKVILIELDVASFGSDLVFEDTYGHGSYPHVYRPIRIEEIRSFQEHNMD
jgi:uncharacterized protein (DUF952 family)